MSAVFVSKNQSDKCFICLEDSEEARKNAGPITNHQGKHGGVHSGCLAQWFLAGNYDCPLCRVPLSARSLEVLEGRIYEAGLLGRLRRATDTISDFLREHEDPAVAIGWIIFIAILISLMHLWPDPGKTANFNVLSVRDIALPVIACLGTVALTVGPVAFAQWLREPQ
ncbi:MAG: RING-H2 finger protein [Chlamydiales bacterium]|nr:RING-H2 finger protein [Chlamydiales bacterium]